jgi:hypothetical protein
MSDSSPLSRSETDSLVDDGEENNDYQPIMVIHQNLLR